MELYRTLKLNKLKIGTEQLQQCTFQKGDLLLGLLHFPLYSISNVYSYCSHSLYSNHEAGKNTFYRFKNNSRINWRSIVKSCNRALFKQIEGAATQSDGSAKCLIIDDTDFAKSTYKTEHVGRIWSHVKHVHILGFKGLFLGYWDGKSFFAMNFSLHNEKGKNKKKPFGLTAKQKKKQLTKKREKGSCGKRWEC